MRACTSSKRPSTRWRRRNTRRGGDLISTSPAQGAGTFPIPCAQAGTLGPRPRIGSPTVSLVRPGRFGTYTLRGARVSLEGAMGGRQKERSGGVARPEPAPRIEPLHLISSRVMASETAAMPVSRVSASRMLQGALARAQNGRDARGPQWPKRVARRAGGELPPVCAPARPCVAFRRCTVGRRSKRL